MIFLLYRICCHVPSNFTSYEAQSETNLAFPYLCDIYRIKYYYGMREISASIFLDDKLVNNKINKLISDIGKCTFSIITEKILKSISSAVYISIAIFIT